MKHWGMDEVNVCHREGASKALTHAWDAIRENN